MQVMVDKLRTNLKPLTSNQLSSNASTSPSKTLTPLTELKESAKSITQTKISIHMAGRNNLLSPEVAGQIHTREGQLIHNKMIKTTTTMEELTTESNLSKHLSLCQDLNRPIKTSKEVQKSRQMHSQYLEESSMKISSIINSSIKLSIGPLIAEGKILATLGTLTILITMSCNTLLNTVLMVMKSMNMVMN